jgi:hypothetical protein
MTHSSIVREPLRVDLARRVTGGDCKYMDRVRDDSTFNLPHVLAGCLADEMADTGSILASYGKYFGPRLATLGKPYRFQVLVGELERCWLPRVPDFPPNECTECQQDFLCTLHIRGDKVFLFAALRKYLEAYLEERIHEEMAAILKETVAGQMQIYAAPVDRGVEGPAGELPLSAITETMYLGDDGFVHQSPTSIRKWTSVTVAYVMDATAQTTELAAASGGAQSSLARLRVTARSRGDAASPRYPHKKRGPKPRKLALAMEAMRTWEREKLEGLLDKELKDQFREYEGRTLLREARQKVLDERPEELATNDDK